MDYPTIPQCYKLLGEYALPFNVIRHSEQVSKISVFIAKKYIENGINLDLELIRVASLLHDIAKPIDFKNYNYVINGPTEEQRNKWNELKKTFQGVGHSEAAAKILSNYPKIAKIVKSHRLLQINKGFDTDEEKIVYYADKLVMHDQITNLKKRLDDIHFRYKGIAKTKADLEVEKKIMDLETEILNKANISFKEILNLNNICMDRV